MKTQLRFDFRLIVGASFILSATLCAAQMTEEEFKAASAIMAAEKEREAKYGPRYYVYPPTQKLGNAWTFERWNGSETPFVQARREIESRLEKFGPASSVTIKELKQFALKNPMEPLAQYRWAYTAYLSRRRLGDQGRNRSPIPASRADSSRWALAFAVNPHSAEYARLRFLCEAGQCTPPELLRPLARRLLTRFSNDLEIKRSYAALLSRSSARSDVEEAMRISEEILKSEPNRATNVGLRAAVYEWAWYRFKRKDEGQQAIEGYEKVLQMIPAGSPDAEQLRDLLADLRKQVGISKSQQSLTKMD